MIYLDHAATTPIPAPVAEEAGDEVPAEAQEVDKSFEDILAIFNRGNN